MATGPPSLSTSQSFVCATLLSKFCLFHDSCRRNSDIATTGGSKRQTATTSLRAVTKHRTFGVAVNLPPRAMNWQWAALMAPFKAKFLTFAYTAWNRICTAASNLAISCNLRSFGIRANTRMMGVGTEGISYKHHRSFVTRYLYCPQRGTFGLLMLMSLLGFMKCTILLRCFQRSKWVPTLCATGHSGCTKRKESA